MRTKLLFYLIVLLLLDSCSGRISLTDGFVNPPDEFKPWCYWWWLNGNVDNKTISEDLESMKDLGFGGLLLVDSRGYWDDDEHVRIPEAAMEFMSDEWLDMVAFSIREAGRLGLEVGLNASSSGGTLKGPWLQGEKSPKKLIYRFENPENGIYKLDSPDLPFFSDVACYAVIFDGAAPYLPMEWTDAGDGAPEMSGDTYPINGTISGQALLKVKEIKELQPSDGKISWNGHDGDALLLRFGSTAIPGHEYDVDILDQDAVGEHIRRILDSLKIRVGDAFGTSFTHLYSVSWEGVIPNWTRCFETGFNSLKGYDLKPMLPILAGIWTGSPDRGFLDDFREARNRMFLSGLYGTMRDVCHEYGLKLFSESGGPWKREPSMLKDADQMAFLAMNDMPQGEFWYRDDGRIYFFTRAVASTAHAFGLRRASAEAFTDMTFHWSECPADLKPLADQAFLDGINHLVWHTFTCSPERFGTPGSEYFAGTHINRNVTWQSEAGPFVGYLARCQFMLQQGIPVADIAIIGGRNVYQHWGHYRETPCEGSSLHIPAGFNYDLFDEEVLLKRLKAKNGRAVLPDGVSYGVISVDPSTADELSDAAQRKLSDLEKSGVMVIRDSSLDYLGLEPDFEGPFHCVHRRVDGTDIYFVAGNGSAEMIFRATGDVQLWDPLNGSILPADARRTADGRTAVRLDMPDSGSAFVVFKQRIPFGEVSDYSHHSHNPVPVEGPWSVSFSYHKLLASPPAPREWEVLHDLTEDEDRDVRWFSGIVSLKNKVYLSSSQTGSHVLSLGCVKKGLAHVFVNGIDCGVCWTPPWSVDVSGVLTEGMNDVEIRFTNTWENRLIGDCILPEEERVTTSNLQYHSGIRGRWLPTRYSGYSSGDTLVSNGILGPVEFR
jgi:hypothetical protein